MNSELYKLFMEYPCLDDDFINRAYEMMLSDEPLLIPFINDFEISREEYDGMGSYSPENKKIIIYPENMKTGDHLHNLKVQALETLRHELEHARNLQRFYEFRHDIESTIIRYTMMDYIVEHKLGCWDPFDKSEFLAMTYPGKREQLYAINPEERLTSIKAWKYMVNFLKNQRRTQDLLDARANLFFAYIRGYESNGVYLNCPTYEFLLKMGMYHEFYLLKNRVEQEQYVFDTRLMYGLPLIDEKEHDAKILQKVRLQKKEKN